jgi:hypothetical protein
VSDPLEKPDGLTWDPAAVQLPEVPLLPPGEDAMSATIAAVLPTLTAPLAASVAALQAKEGMFSGKLVAAESAYQNADDSGQQSIGQLAGMLGQVGQMGQQAGAPAQAAGGLGGQTGMFGSLMQQVMQGAQGGQGAQGAQSTGGAAGGAPQGQAPTAGGGQPQPAREEPVGAAQPERPQEPQPDDGAMAGPSEADDKRQGPAPVTPHENSRRAGGESDLARDM